MKIGMFPKYKGYSGTIEYDYRAYLYYGKLINTDDFVNYHAKSPHNLYEHFKKAVDDYIEFLEEINKKE